MSTVIDLKKGPFGPFFLALHVYLFDWGDTLMVDFPGTPGKMCDWQVVEAGLLHRYGR